MSKIDKEVLQKVTVPSGRKIDLADFPTEASLGDSYDKLDSDEAKDFAVEVLEKTKTRLAAAQELLYVSNKFSILVVFQAMDAAGKDGAIRYVMSGVNPQGCQVFSFKAPTEEELDHTFLWRCMKVLPERGRIGIFNRSYYEEVLVVKVHQSFLDAQRLPVTTYDDEFWAERYEDINAFERHLVRNGTIVLKFLLHISKDEQKIQLMERIEVQEKNWKFNIGDLTERGYWDNYMQAYEDCLTATSTDWAPWYVIPMDKRMAGRALIADIITRTIEELKLEYPRLSATQKEELAQGKAMLEAETPSVPALPSTDAGKAGKKGKKKGAKNGK